MVLRTWRLHPACRVRAEKFGLLFYDARGPKLLFAETGDSLPETFFSEPGQQAALLGRLASARQRQLITLFEKLEAGGWINEQPIC